MGVRPPRTDDQDASSSVEFGIAAVDAHLDDADLAFPATDEEVVAALGDPGIPYDPGGRTVDLSTALDRVSRQRFDSRTDLLNALHPVFEEYRTESASGVVEWMRSLLP